MGGPGGVLEQYQYLCHRRRQANPVVCPIKNGEIQPQEDVTQDPEAVAKAVIEVAVADVGLPLGEKKTDQSARALTCHPFSI